MKRLYLMSRRCHHHHLLPLLLSSLLVLSFQSTTTATKLAHDEIKSLIINNGTLWKRNSLTSCSNVQIGWERTVVKPSEGSHRAVTTKISTSNSDTLRNVIVADFVSDRAFVDINQMKLAGVDIEIFTENGKREFDIEAPSWSPAAEPGIVFTALKYPYDEAEIIMNVHIRYQNFTESGGMCDEFVALEEPKVFVVCENGGVDVKEIDSENKPEKLIVSVSIGATNVSDGVALVTFVFSIIGALLIILASFI